MKNKHFSLLAVLIVLFGFIGCPDNNDNEKEEEEIPVETPTGMQVYNTDRTTPYTGADLDFYIQGDAVKTVAATVKNGKLTLNYIPLPTGITYSTDIPLATEKTPDDLARVEIILLSMAGNKALELQRVSTGNTRAQMFYFNKNGSYKIGDTLYNIVQGWNFLFQGASVNPDRFLSGNFGGFPWVWVLKDN